jgi:polysaccharide biosynthesis protein PslG
MRLSLGLLRPTMDRMRVRLIALCVGLVIVAAGIAAARAAHPPDDGHAAVAAARLRLGVVANTLGWGAAVGRAQSVAAQSGARWLREEISWSTVAPRQGERHWGALDRLFVAAAHRRLTILPLINDAPAWAAGRDGALPTDASAYAAFVGDVVARYGPAGNFWRNHPHLDARRAPAWFELWNEPYLARPVHGAITARRYAALAAAAIRAGRAADPGARFLLAVDPSVPGGDDDDGRWLDRLEQAKPGLLAAADGVAAHPYAADGSASLQSLDHLRAALVAHHRPGMPIWVTEVGWTTCARSADCVTERVQADDLRAFLAGVVRKPSRAAAVFYYHLRSWRTQPGDQFYGNFGLLRFDLSRKPAWTVFRAFARGLQRAGAG